MVFYYVLRCLVSHAMIGIADRLRDHDNATGIGNNSAEIGDDAEGIINIATNLRK